MSTTMRHILRRAGNLLLSIDRNNKSIRFFKRLDYLTKSQNQSLDNLHARRVNHMVTRSLVSKFTLHAIGRGGFCLSEKGNSHAGW